MGGRVRRVAIIGVLAAAGVIVALAGPTTAGAQEDQRKVDVDLAYQCARPTDRTWAVTLHVTATFPTSGKTGEPVQPTDVALALSVPPEVLADLSAAGAVTATSTVKLDTSIVQDKTAASATWGASGDQPVPLVADGPTVFTGTATPEPVTVNAAGDLSFTAAGLTATLTGWTADGTATEPPSTDLTCVPDGDAALAVVRMSDVDAPTPEVPEPGIKVGSQAAAPSAQGLADVPKECHKLPAPKDDHGNDVPGFQSYCAKLTGFTNVNKLNASALQPAGLINISAGSFARNCDGVTGKFCSWNAVLPNNPEPPPAGSPPPPDPQPNDPRYPKAPASFFIFGAIPTTGTMQLKQLDTGSVYIWFQGTTAGEVTARLRLSVQLLEAYVNGTKVKLGRNCMTETPIDAVLKATPATYSITNGGVLTGTVTIPPFSGCGETEDLDPLLTGLISGPNNYVKMTQGKVCSLGNGVNCPPVAPTPQR
ncbi:DUF6801 domain-containing protein [Actinophytocola sp.]|uniref:DUF6801 domain-containing protein n=1 Tax=Actinophytocola sp. TaxID=1872138 RepID=UPI003899C6A6